MWYMKDKELEKIFKSFANKRRIAIVRFLKNEKEATVGTISEKINLSFKSTSRHLSVLFSADIIEKDQRSLQVFYCLSTNLSEPARKIISLL